LDVPDIEVWPEKIKTLSRRTGISDIASGGTGPLAQRYGSGALRRVPSQQISSRQIPGRDSREIS
jgi:hypothetical protein